MIAAPLRYALAIFLLVMVIVGLVTMQGGGIISILVAEEQRGTYLAITATLYTLLLAIPFVPGVELGWMIIGVFGKIGILVSWLSTVVGLTLSFWVARCNVGHPWMNRLNAARRHLQATPPQQLSASQRALRFGVCLYAKHPYLFIFLTLNLPGNWVIGGGGGIAATAGISSKVLYWRFLLTCVVATGIVPTLLWFGLIQAP